jgi:hypothetical protein
MQLTNQQAKILNYLRAGHTLTNKQAFRLFKARRLSGRIAELRQAGYPIYLNEDGYRLGTPSRKMVAAAYRVFGGALFQ